MNAKITISLHRTIVGCAAFCLLATVCLARGGGGGFGGGGRGFGGGGGGGWGGGRSMGGDSFGGGSVRYSGGDRSWGGDRSSGGDRSWGEGRSSRSDFGGGDRTSRSDFSGDRSSYRSESGSREFSGNRETRSFDGGNRSFTNDNGRRTYSADRDPSAGMSREARTQERNFSVPPSNMGSVRSRNMDRSPSDRSFSGDRNHGQVKPGPGPSPKPGPGPSPKPGPRPGPKPGPMPGPHPGPNHHWGPGPGPRPYPGPGWHHPAPYWRPYSYNGWNYWRYNNCWYRPYYYCGSVWYFNVGAPIGFSINVLPAPADYQVVVLSGQTYYVINGDYYIQSVQNGQTVYVVTQKPTVTVAPTVVQTSAPQPNTPSLDPFEVMSNMSNFLSMQNTFTVTVEDTYDEPSATGVMVQRSSLRTVYMNRPSEMAVNYDGDDGNSRLLYNGVSLYSINLTQNIFSSAPMPAGIDAMLDTMSQQYGINLPLADFLYSNPGQAMLAGVRSGQYIGMSIISGVTCHHLAFVSDTVDWEIWIQATKQPLPMKLMIIYKNEDKKPRYTMTINQWRLGSVPANAFNLNIPTNAQQVPMQPIQQADTATGQVPATQPATSSGAVDSQNAATTQPAIMPGPPPAGAVPVQ